MHKLGILLMVFAASCSRGASARADERQAAPPPVAADTKAAAGPRAEGKGFVVEVKAPDGAKVGAATSAKVVLRPTGGYHVNKEFPTQLTVTPPAGVDLAKPKQAGSDAAKLEEDGAVFDVAFTPKDGGDKRFEASFKFAVCTADTCDPKAEKLAWTVAVK